MARNRGWAYAEQIGSEAAGTTVLAHFVASRRHSSPGEWSDRIARGEVEVDGARARPDTILNAGQTLIWHRPPWEEPDVPLHFDILHEDEALLAAIKPSGLPTMPAGGFLEHTLLTLVRAKYPEANPLHRLGRFTSGIVLFARTRESAALMARAWRDHDIEKHYRALGCGVASEDRFEIDTPIGTVPHPALGTVHAASAEGKPSHSVARVLERRADSTLFSVTITTGRPHQIRIHLAWAGHPLVGDPLYGPGGVLKEDPGLPGDGGYLLHAERLIFVHPLTGMTTSLHATPPPELQGRL